MTIRRNNRINIKQGTFRLFSFLLLFVLLLSSAFAQSEKERFNFLEDELLEYSILDRKRALDLIAEMSDIAGNSEDSISLRIRTLYSETIFHQRQGIKDSTLQDRIEDVMQMPSLSKRDEVLLQCAYGNILLTNYDYAESFKIFIQLLEQAKQMDDSLLVARILNTLGVITNNLYLSQMSQEYYQEAVKWASLNPNEHVFYLIQIVLISSELQAQAPPPKESKAMAILESLEALANRLEAELQYGLLTLLLMNNASAWTLYANNQEKTFEYLTRAEQLCKDNLRMKSLIYSDLGMFYLNREEDDLAMDYFQKAKAGLEQSELPNFLYSVYRNIAAIHEESNQTDSLVHYLKKGLEVLSKRNQNSHVSTIHRNYITNELALSESKIKMKNKQVAIILISALALIIIAVLVVIIFTQKQRSMRQTVLLKDIESKELASRLEREQALKEFQKKQLEDKLREITAYSLHLSSKNQAINQIAEIMDESPNVDKTAVKKIKDIIKENQQIDNDWDDFFLHFKEVHPHFFGELSKLHSEFSQSEIRLAAYIRLGLSIKQIAQMLNITPESVKTSRYRLRKKMGLSKEDTLDSVIQSL